MQCIGLAVRHNKIVTWTDESTREHSFRSK